MRRATGAQLGGERRHIQAEDDESKATISGRADDTVGPGRRSWLHCLSVWGDLAFVTREQPPDLLLFVGVRWISSHEAESASSGLVMKGS